MQAALAPFHEAHVLGRGYEVADILSSFPPPNNPGRLYDFHRASNERQIEGDVRYALKYSKVSHISAKESIAWTEIIVDYWHVVTKILSAEEATNKRQLGDRQWVEVYEAWRNLTQLVSRHISNGVLPPWGIWTLLRMANHLRLLAVRADEQLAKARPMNLNPVLQDDIAGTVTSNQKLEEAARVFNRIFSLCLGDRNPNPGDSRKWAVYCVANLQFRTYFKLKAISLSKNVVKSIGAQGDLPPFSRYPLGHQVTYKYYTGVLSFLQEDYPKAEEYLQEAWAKCRQDALRNQERILTYLIPCRLLTRHAVPTATLLSSYPNLKQLFGPLISCIKSGNLAGFDEALLSGEQEFVKRRVFLTLERSRDIALRNLLRKVYLAEGWEDLKEGQTETDRIRKSRIPISHFATAIRIAGNGQAVEDDEVECLLANMIYKQQMKGYIARERGMVVLNKKGAFPNTGV
ncbi:hypothetical protein BDV95DRAFT_579069 [Massariosphaeria phaeospora]|uniref:Protein CSN12 homolog n=1 Tax=Massariosphaeria phaeospora TaxID=100035 RepID=A0A7C8M6E9_9PLEO|nr:hypothetical protein BDV95DRAFT_579069 [Massariosphaeria phaeospora]